MALVDDLIRHDYEWTYTVNLFDNVVVQCCSHYIFNITTLSPFAPILLGN